MEKNMVLNDEAAFNRGVLFQYLRMLSSGFLKDQWYDKNKVNELNLFLNESVTIFYNWNMELESIKEFAKNNDIVTYEINGFNFQLDEFLNEKRISWMLINYKSGAEAIDGLQFKTNKSIFYSLPLSGSLLEQAHKRVNRIGQESKNIDYYYLIRENSLEEDILKNLSKYRNYTEKIFSNYLKKML